MLTIQSKTFPLGAGNSVYAGRTRPTGGGGGGGGGSGTPAWLAAQAINTWGLIPGGTMNAVDPRNNASLNPVYPSPPPWGGNGQAAMITAWNSMGVNQATGEVFIGGTGGHADYGGNECNSVLTKAEATSWVLRRPPSGAIGYPITDGGPGAGINSTTGIYSDGRPRPTHTYNGLVYVPGRGLVVTNLNYAWPNLSGPYKAFLFNENTNDWELFCDYSALGDSNNPVSGCCYDSKRDCIWIIPNGTYNMLKIDCTTRVATRHGTIDNNAQYASCKYSVADDLIIITSNSGMGYRDYPSRMTAFDPMTDTFNVIPPYTGSLPAGMAVNSQGTGWDEENGRLILWGGTDRKELGILTRPSGNPRTTAWIASSMPIASGNSVTPSAAPAAGTFGRGDYVAALGGYLLLNSSTEQFYFFKTKTTP